MGCNLQGQYHKRGLEAHFNTRVAALGAVGIKSLWKWSWRYNKWVVCMHFNLALNAMVSYVAHENPLHHENRLGIFSRELSCQQVWRDWMDVTKALTPSPANDFCLLCASVLSLRPRNGLLVAAVTSPSTTTWGPQVSKSECQWCSGENCSLP